MTLVDLRRTPVASIVEEEDIRLDKSKPNTKVSRRLDLPRLVLTPVMFQKSSNDEEKKYYAVTGPAFEYLLRQNDDKSRYIDEGLLSSTSLA